MAQIDLLKIVTNVQYNANRNHLAVLFSWRAAIEVFDKSNFVDANCTSAAREFPLTSGLFPAMEKPRSDGGVIGKTRWLEWASGFPPFSHRFSSVYRPFFTVFHRFHRFPKRVRKLTKVQSSSVA
jgi:hypothetical protein